MLLCKKRQEMYVKVCEEEGKRLKTAGKWEFACRFADKKCPFSMQSCFL